MRRPRVLALLCTALIALFIVWVAQNTYWEDTTVPMPMRGEARINPFYAAQRFAEALGARTRWNREGLTLPPPDGVMVLSTWNWELSASRRQALETWVESGGRLVVDNLLIGSRAEFEAWSGILQEFKDDDVEEREEPEEPNPFEAIDESRKPCPEFAEQHGSAAGPGRYRVCDLELWTLLKSRDAAPEWALAEDAGLQALRVRVGNGSVTAINAAPFRYRSLFDGDHGRLLVAATQLRRGDQIHFQSEDDHPSLLTLIWRYGAPVVTLSLALVAALLWRGAVRFGPLVAPTDAARRSMAEQIRGTAWFALRHGGGDALHGAAVRALNEAGQRRIAAFGRLSSQQRTAALARYTGLNPAALTAAINHSTLKSQELRNRIALLEAARRQLLVERTGSPHDAE